MHSNSSFCVLTDVQELPDNRVIRGAPIHKEKIMMFKAGVCKTPGIIHLLVKANDSGDVVFPKVRNVGLWSVQRVPCGKTEKKHASKFRWWVLKWGQVVSHCKIQLPFSILLFG